MICMGRYDCPVDLLLVHGYNFEYEVLLVVLFSFHFGPAIYPMHCNAMDRRAPKSSQERFRGDPLQMPGKSAGGD